MPYYDLGLTDTQYVPSQDDGISAPIYVDFPFGGQIQPVIYVRNLHYNNSVLCITLHWCAVHNIQVGTNGYFTFDGYTGYSPFLFNASRNLSLVAPFFTDIDISNGIGQISYEIHNESVSEPILSSVDSVINEYLQTDFHGEWLLVAKWDDVPHFRGGPENVGFYILLVHILSSVHFSRQAHFKEY